MNITIRTPQGHARAVSRSAGIVPANLPDAKVDESAYAALMRKSAVETRRRARMCSHDMTPRVTQDMIWDGLTKPMTVRELSEHFGTTVETIRGGLKRMEANGQAEFFTVKNINYWRRAEG